LGSLIRETVLAQVHGQVPGTLRLLGLVGTPGTHLAWWGIAVTILAAPVDDLWHRLFGLDVSLWSPPHLLGLLGSQVNSAGCFVLALETYPHGHRARLLALLVGGALFFGGFHLLLATSILWAYAQGGLAFFFYPALGTLLLPVALLPVARLTARHSAPALAVLMAAVFALAGGGVTRAGFALFNPESAIDDAIARDPGSPVAKAHQMARDNGGPVVTYTGRARSTTWALLPALALGLVHRGRRPVLGSLAFAVTYLAIASWSLAQLPALKASLPTAPQVLAGAVLVAAAGALGGLLGHGLARALAEPR
jgi:hypothetical protein